MGTDANGNGSSGDWAQLFASFHDRHRDEKGRKRKYTPVFNATMEAFSANPEVPLEWRVLAFIWRHSWGNAADYVVDKIGSDASLLGQKDIAARMGIPHRRISENIVLLREMNYLAPNTGHLIQPIEDPARNTPSGESLENPAPSGLFYSFCSLWKVQALADFQELQSAEATVNRIKKVRLEAYKKWKRGRTKSGASLIHTPDTINDNAKAAAAADVSGSSGEPSNGFAAAAAAGSLSSTLPPENPLPQPSTALVPVPIPVEEPKASVDLKDYPQFVHKVRKEIGLERTPDSLLMEIVAGVRAKAIKHGFKPAAASDKTLCQFLDPLEKPEKSARLYLRLKDGRDGTLLEYADIIFGEAAANGGLAESPPPSARLSDATRRGAEMLKAEMLRAKQKTQ